jgi:hypothetical protein
MVERSHSWRAGYGVCSSADRWIQDLIRRLAMDIETLRSFFMWCTILNGALLILAFLISAFAGDWVYRMQSRWYPIPRDAFTIVMYSFLGLFKILLLVFNLVPYVALVIVG